MKIEIQIESARKSINEILDNLLHSVRGDAEFLASINAPIIASDEPKQNPELPDLSDIEIPETKKNIIERDSKEFLALAEFSMLKGWEKTNVDNFLISKGLALTDKDEKHLEELRKFGKLVKADKMDVTALLAQNCLSEIERSFLTSKYLF